MPPRPPGGGLGGKDEVGGREPASRCKEPTQQSSRDGEGRIGHNSKRTAGKSEIGDVGLHDDHGAVPEPLSKTGRPARTKFDGDDPSARGEQFRRDHPVARTDVEHEVARAHTGAPYQLGGVRLSEPIEPPPCPFPGHGAP
jgi:hypothetical protein